VEPVQFNCKSWSFRHTKYEYKINDESFLRFLGVQRERARNPSGKRNSNPWHQQKPLGNVRGAFIALPKICLDLRPYYCSAEHWPIIQYLYRSELTIPNKWKLFRTGTGTRRGGEWFVDQQCQNQLGEYTVPWTPLVRVQLALAKAISTLLARIFLSVAKILTIQSFQEEEPKWLSPFDCQGCLFNRVLVGFFAPDFPLRYARI
jgi:hypothetical protein